MSEIVSLPSVNIDIFAFRWGYGIFVSAYIFVMEVDVLDGIGGEEHDCHIEEADNFENILIPVNELMWGIDGCWQDEHESEVGLNRLNVTPLLEGVVDVKFAYSYPSK